MRILQISLRGHSFAWVILIRIEVGKRETWPGFDSVVLLHSYSYGILWEDSRYVPEF